MPPGALHSTDQTVKQARAKLNKDDQSNVGATNAALDCLLERGVFASRDPYVLTIPQTVEERYRHRNPYQAYQYTDNTPFGADEWENLQYQTFHYYDPDRSMYRQHVNTYSDESTPKVKAATPAKSAGSAPKKVMSLNAYKNKKSGQTPLPEAQNEEQTKATKHTSLKDPAERTKAESADIVAAAEQAEKEHGSQDHEDEEAQNKRKGDLKRRKEDDQDSGRDAEGGKSQTVEPAAKKSRISEGLSSAKQTDASLLSPDHDDRLKKRHGTQSATEHGMESHEAGMPPKLSPLREANTSLPDRLSPTLPANIQAALHSRSGSRLSAPSRSSATSKSEPAKDGKHTSLATVANSDKKHKSPVPIKGFRASSNSPAVKEQLTKDNEREKSSSSDQSLVVKLKLKGFQDKVTNGTSTQHDDESAEKKATATSMQSNRTGKGVAQSIGPNKASKGRSKATEEAPKPNETHKTTSTGKSAKPSVTPASDGRPITPGQPDTRSPESLQKLLPPTPSSRNALRTAAMGRTQSSDSQSYTPSGQQNTPLVNGYTFHPQDAGKPRPPSSAIKNAAQQAWEAEQKRLETLGRELKHAAEAHSKATPVEPQLAAVKALESFICYLLAFSCADEVASTADPKQAPSIKPWRSLSGFFNFVKRNCEPFPLLAGVAHMLGMGFSSHLLEITEKYPSEGPSRDTIIEFSGIFRRSSVEVDAKLDIDTLAESFPKTWKGRSKGYSSTDDTLVAGKLLQGPYKLPVGAQMLPVSVARVGQTILAEWLEKEGLEYRLRITE